MALLGLWQLALIGIIAIVIIIIGIVIIVCRWRKLHKIPMELYTFPGSPELSMHNLDDVERQVERKDMSSVDMTNESSTTVVREDRKRAYRGKGIGVETYLNKVLGVLFMVFGLLTITLSVVLDNSYNDKPVRFIPFGILAPFTIFFGFLASGWFRRVPLRLIALLKRHKFLRNVMPCSPWHDNVVTNFTGTICTLEPTESSAPTYLPRVLHTFLYGTVITHSPLASSWNALLQESSVRDSVPHIGATSQSDGPTVMSTGIAPSRAQETVVQRNRSTMFHVSGDGQTLTFRGPTVGPAIGLPVGFPLRVEVSKNTSSTGTFDLTYSFRDMKTRRMYLNSKRLHILAENMARWVENPHPIVVDDSSDILHCMPIQDILWEFTKSFYTFHATEVHHRFLGCLCDERMEQFALIALVVTTSLSGLIPVLSDTKSLYYLFLATPIMVYVLIVVARRLNAYCLLNHCLKLLLCPLFLKVSSFPRLYKCKSFFIWCNEFRKQRVVDPERFLIDQETVNCLLEDGETCFVEDGSVGLPDSTPGEPERTSPITLECLREPEKLHGYKLVMNFMGVRDGSYIDLTLKFYEHKDLLDNRLFYGSTKVEKVQLIEKLFSYYSDPKFGGYVETIRPCCWLYLGHCPRFLDICMKIIREDRIILEAKRKPDCRLVIGDSSLISVKSD